MWILLGVVLLIISVIIIFFNIPYSKIKSQFEAEVVTLISEQVQNGTNNSEANKMEYFSEEDVGMLPEPVQKYFAYCGWVGKPKMTYIKIHFNNVDFSLGRGKKTIKMNYTQFNMTDKPNRIAYIDSFMFGIPFEGKDTFIDGHGSMKGMLGKLFTLFDQKGREMDQASLVTYLSESLVNPNAALQKFISWRPIDDLHAEATISYLGIRASGIFKFNTVGELVSFTTLDREAVAMDGSKEKVKWSAYFSDYIQNINGTKQPTTLQAVWNYEEGDLLYFDGKNAEFEYGHSS